MTPLEVMSAVTRSKGWKIGFVNGCFDLLHDGHKHLLNEARKRCDVLFVAVNDDNSVKEMKGIGRPVQPLSVRIAALEKTGLCDGILGFGTEDELYSLVKQVKPDCMVKGEDYRDRKITGAELCERIVFVPLLPGVSTTKLLQS